MIVKVDQKVSAQIMLDTEIKPGGPKNSSEMA